MQTTWTVWQLDRDRHAIELDDTSTPPGCAIELEIISGGGCASTFGLWRWSESGAVLAIVRAAEA